MLRIDRISYYDRPGTLWKQSYAYKYRLGVSILQGQEQQCQKFRCAVYELVWLLLDVSVPEY